MSEKVLVERSGGVVSVILNRPQRRNALDTEMWERLADLFAEERSAAVVILRGAEGAFSAGGDIEAMKARRSWPAAEQLARMRRIGRAVLELARLPMPVVAALEGPVFGAGASLALACDLRLARDDVQIAFGFLAVGLGPDMGSSVLLPRAVGEARALELVLTGRKVGAEEALRLGLVGEVVSAAGFDAVLAGLGERLAAGPAGAQAGAKALLRRGLVDELEDALEEEALLQVDLFETDDHKARVDAFLKRRR